MFEIYVKPLSCDLFVRSYWKDLEWLTLCLASITKYCRGFRSVIIVLPRSSEPWLRRFVLPPGVRVELCDCYRDDYLGQQVTKLLADTFTDADYICHVDSDCVFFRSISPEDLIVNGKPHVLMRPCDTLGRHRPWQKPTEQFLRSKVTDDFMYHPPFTFPRWLYARLREHSLAIHGVDIETYVTAQLPRGFSEYNALGAFAWRHYRDRFSWVDITISPSSKPHCRWYWSWGGIDAAIRGEIRAILDAGDERNRTV